MSPAPLADEHLRNCRLFASREELLERLPKFGIGAEIGVDRGHFSEMIFSITQPRELNLFDLTDRRLSYGVVQVREPPMRQRKLGDCVLCFPIRLRRISQRGSSPHGRSRLGGALSLTSQRSA